MTRGQATGAGQTPIAIIGLGCLFPRAGSLTEYWRLLVHGEDAITEVPPTHWRAADYFDADPKRPDHVYCTRGGFLSPVRFDPTEFGIPPNTLEATDTTQLLSLVAARAALQDAGYTDDREFNRDRVGVILGVTGTQELVIPLGARLGHPLWRRALADAGIAPEVAEYVVRRIADGYVPWQENSFPGLLGNVVAGRIANRLNLRGTNCVIDAACASSLGAVHLAMLELAAGRSDMVLTGGADTLNDIFMYMCFSKTPALSPTGDARPFASDADGTVLGEGVGMLVLKRLEDAERDGDRIYAVLRAMGTSSDGRSQSIYAPHAGGQARCLRNAYAQAGFAPDTVGLIEAHGTGTQVGDATEYEALQTVLREARSEGTWCALGSVKSQLGHTKAAAGAAGLIKAALAIYHRSLPPTIKIKTPLSHFSSPDNPLYLNTEPRPWVTNGGAPRRAGVSAFGFGGSNFHAVLEAYPSPSREPAWDGSVQIIAVSAGSRNDLLTRLDEIRSAVAAGGLSADELAWTAAESRRTFRAAEPHRLVIVLERGDNAGAVLSRVRTRLDAADASTSWQAANAYYGCGAPDGAIAFLFPGQGSQYVGMGRRLACTFPEMIDALAAADDEAAGAGDGESQRVSDLIYPIPAFTDSARDAHASALTRTDGAQPALGALSAGFTGVLARFGVQPGLAAGHSFGELVALWAAGRFDATTLHRLARLRGRLMAGHGEDRGAMLAVKAPFVELERLIRSERLEVVIANRNAPRQCVLSGPRQAVARAAERCRTNGFVSAPLPVSGAFHSPLMREAAGPFRQALSTIPFAAGSVPVVADATAREYPADAGLARSLLADQLTSPVDFVGVVQRLYALGARTFVEVGPQSVLTRLVGAILGNRTHARVAIDASAGRRDGVADLARVLAQLAAAGYAVDLTKWERPAAEPRRPRMVIPLVGANYRAGKTESALTGGAARSSEDDPAPRAQRKDGAMQEKQPHMGNQSEIRRSEAIPAALQIVQDALRSMQALQEQTAAAHQRFLEGQERAHRIIQEMLESQQRLLAGTLTTSISSTGADVGSRTTGANELGTRNSERGTEGERSQAANVGTETPPFVESTMSAPAPVKPGPIPESKAENKPTIVPSSDVRVPNSEFDSIVLDVVCEKTGYPREMIELDMDIEADLGIDSIKRVEIVAAIEERVPGFGGVRPDQMGGLRTLRQILELMDPGDQADLASNETPARDTDEPPGLARRLVGAETPVVRAEKSGAPSDSGTDDFATTLIDVVAELTGYPTEMIELDMDLEADLGIDSIKRVEILAGVESRVPNLPPVRPESMGSLRTLRQVVEHYGGSAPRTVPAVSTNVENRAATVRERIQNPLADSRGSEKDATPTNAASEQDTVRRRVLATVELPPATAGHLRIAPGHEIWISDDGSPLAAALHDRLASAGLAVRVVAPQEIPQRRREAPVGGFVFLAPVASAQAADDETHHSDFLKHALAAARALAGDLQSAAEQGGALFATVARMDGAFGLVGGDFDPRHGGLAGLAKTAAQEWPAVRCRAIDAARSWCQADSAADAIVHELTSDGPIEVGLDDAARRGLQLVEKCTGRQEPFMTESDVVLVSGGARGVTAEAAVALAESCRPSLVLLGRSDVSDTEPDWLAGIENHADIKRTILHNEFAASADRPTPAQLERVFQRYMAAREIRRTLERIRAAGATARYRAVDVRDAAAVRRAIDDVQSSVGPIRGVVHAAGVLEDRRIVDKTPGEFDRVFDTKVGGLKNILDALNADQLRIVALFSSVAARFGNAGQADYAMANEVLNKTAQHLARRMPACRVVSLNWGPWDGGMVTESLKGEFTRRGVSLIAPRAGARAFVNELSCGGREVEVVLGSGFDAAALFPLRAQGRVRVGAPCDSSTPMFVAFEHNLALAQHPFLESHRLGGRPMLPAVMMLEWLGHAALHACPGLLLAGLSDFRVLKGVAAEPDGPALRFLTAAPRTSDGRTLIDVELQSAGDDGRPIRHARATAVLTSTLPTAPPQAAFDALAVETYPRTVADAYADTLFHGRHFHGIREVIGYSHRGIVGIVSTAPPPRDWMLEPLRGRWLSDPLAIDAAFQLAILWSMQHVGVPSLPAHIAHYRRYRAGAGDAVGGDRLTCAVAVREQSAHRLVADISFIDRDGVAALIEGYEATLDASLLPHFRGAASLTLAE